jgi:hypothetical protein
VADLAAGHQLLDDGLDRAGGNREADADVAAVEGNDLRIDTDQFTAGVDQGSAGVAWLKGASVWTKS